MPFIPHFIVDRLQSLPTIEVAERLGLGRPVHNACRCFMHDDHDPSLRFLGRGRQDWRCFVCNKGGHGPISLVMAKEGVDFVRACEILGSMYGIYWMPEQRNIHYKPTRVQYSHKVVEEKPFSEEVCNWIVENSVLSYEAKHFLYEERQFSQKAVESLNIGSVSDSRRLLSKLRSVFSEDELKNSGLIKEETGNLKLFTPCLLFPYYDMDGKLIGLQTRYLRNSPDSPRFQFISHYKTRLFNLPILRTLRPGDELYIAEGVTDCLALMSSGKKAVAIPSATLIPKEDIILLRDFNLKMYNDADEAGLKAFYEIQSILISTETNIKRIALPDGWDFCDYYLSTKNL